MRGFVFSILGLLVAIIATQTIAGSPRYTVTQLNALSTAVGAYAAAHDINDSGVVVGAEFLRGAANTSSTHPLIWSGGPNPSNLAVVDGYGGEAKAINEAGQVVGTSVNASAQRATRFSSSVATFLPVRTSGSSTANAIDDLGLIAGNDGLGAFAFSALTDTYSNLNPGGVTSYQGVKTRSDGGVLAQYYASPSRVVLLRADVAPQYVTQITARAFIFDANRSGIGTGSSKSTTPNGPTLPALFFSNDATTTTFSVPGYTFGVAYALNDRLDVVGLASSKEYASPSLATPFLRRNGFAVALSSLVDGSLPANFVPIGINNRGQIIGNANYDDDGDPATFPLSRPYLLNPIRTPGDTDYSGTVDFADLLTLAQHYGQSGNGNVFFETGDFNYDWAVGFDDLLALAQNYNAPASIAEDWALAQSLVPEPASLGMMAGALAMSCRRRR